MIPEEKVTTLIEPTNGQKPTHYILNNTSPNTFNTSYNNTEDYRESITINGILYGEDVIESGEIEDLGTYTLINELDVCKGESKAKNKILYGSNYSNK